MRIAAHCRWLSLIYKIYWDPGGGDGRTSEVVGRISEAAGRIL
jgi:hypothetical protein